MAEAGVKETCIMHAEFAHHRQIRGHFCGVFGRDGYSFAADQNVERTGVEDDLTVVAVHLFPVLRGVIMADLV